MKEQLESLVAELVGKGVPLPLAREQFEKRYIALVIEQTKGNQSKAARLLHMHRNTLSRRLEAYQLNGGKA